MTAREYIYMAGVNTGRGVKLQHKNSNTSENIFIKRISMDGIHRPKTCYITGKGNVDNEDEITRRALQDLKPKRAKRLDELTGKLARNTEDTLSENSCC